MKKYNVFKVMGIVILLTMLVSYFVPQTTVSYGEVKQGALNPVGFIDTFSNSITALNVFVAPFIFILVVGVFYKILKKTEKYDEIVNNFAVKFDNNKGLFAVISILFFGIISAVIGDMLPMLVFVPFFMAVAIKLGYSKLSSVASTVGAIIVGSAGSLYTNIMNQILYTTVQTNLVYKVIISLVGLVSLIAFVLIFNKPAKTEAKLEKVASKKQLPIVISMILIFVLVVLGMTPWSTYFKFTGFEDLFKSITDFKLFDVSLYNAFIGSSVAAWGTWQLYDVAVLLAVVGLILVIVYRIKFNEFLELAASAVKRALPYALIIVIANIALVNVYSSGWFYTVIKALSGSKFNMFLGSIISALSAIVYPDYSYGVQFTVATITYVISNNTFYSLLQIVYQAIYSTFLLVSPTSILILLGLYHLNISFKDWIKYIWKYFLILLATNLIILSIVAYGFSVSVIFALIILLVVITMLVVRRINDVKNEMIESKKVVKEETKKEDKEKISDLSEKDWVVTLLLCLFFGNLGVHRFYVNKVGSGLGQLFTCGGCGIWALVDLIMIITGNFEDSEGRKIVSQNKKEAIEKETAKKAESKKTTTKKKTTQKKK